MVWDFHDRNPKWIENFDFVYTNSLDQAWKPFQAISCWLEQIKTNGLIIIEHSRQHGVEGTSSMDPFGVLPEYMPYVIAEHYGNKVSISITKSIKSNYNLEVWLFILKKLGN